MYEFVRVFVYLYECVHKNMSLYVCECVFVCMYVRHPTQTSSLACAHSSGPIQACMQHSGRDCDREQHPAELPVRGGVPGTPVQLEEL